MISGSHVARGKVHQAGEGSQKIQSTCHWTWGLSVSGMGETGGAAVGSSALPQESLSPWAQLHHREVAERKEGSRAGVSGATGVPALQGHTTVPPDAWHVVVGRAGRTVRAMRPTWSLKG